MKSYDVFRDRTRSLRATDDLNEIYRAKCQRLEEENGRLIYMLFGDGIPSECEIERICCGKQIDYGLRIPPMARLGIRFRETRRVWDPVGVKRYSCELMLPRGTRITRLQAALMHNMIAESLKPVIEERVSKEGGGAE